MSGEEWVGLLHGRQTGASQYQARCPAHDDQHASLAVNTGADKVLLHCHAGCTLEEIVHAMGKTVSDLYPDERTTYATLATYAYSDVAGTAKLRKIRKADKQFRWDHWDGREWKAGRNGLTAALYNVDEVANKEALFWVEGEKDVETMRAHGLTAVSASDGVKTKLTPEHLAPLRDKHVAVLPDNDKQGRAHAETVAGMLQGIAASVRVVDLAAKWPELPEKGDISDLYAMLEHDPYDELMKLVAETAPWNATEAPPPQGMRLQTISARDLQSQELPPLEFLVDEILPQGLGMVAAPSKYGKSFLSLDLCLSVAAGGVFLGYQTRAASTLYLALEDGQRRLKGRMELILQGDTAPEGFFIATAANTIDNGLTDQINGHLREYPETKLIVIDVLERVRSSVGRSTNAYALDYQNMGALKTIADRNNLCVLVVHHTRKMKDEADVYNMISGTNGLMGACDTIWVMSREKRDDPKTTLHMIGRDIEQQSIIIQMDRCKWRRIGTVEEEAARNERSTYNADPAVRTIKHLLALNPLGFECSASEFFADMGRHTGEYGGHSPSTLGKHFMKLAPLLLRFDRIIHGTGRSERARRHRFGFLNDTTVTNDRADTADINDMGLLMCGVVEQGDLQAPW